MDLSARQSLPFVFEVMAPGHTLDVPLIAFNQALQRGVRR